MRLAVASAFGDRLLPVPHSKRPPLAHSSHRSRSRNLPASKVFFGEIRIQNGLRFRAIQEQGPLQSTEPVLDSVVVSHSNPVLISKGCRLGFHHLGKGWLASQNCMLEICRRLDRQLDKPTTVPCM